MPSPRITKPDIHSTPSLPSVPQSTPVSGTDKSIQAITRSIFQAKASQGIHYTSGDRFQKGALTLIKWLFFPLTIPISALFKKIAQNQAISDGSASVKSQENVTKLEALGGRAIVFKTEDGLKLEGMTFQSTAPNKSGKTLLICSGDNNSSEYYNEPIVKAMLALGHNVMTFNYRGFGDSEGNVSESGLYKDVDAAYQYLRNSGIDNKDLIVYGYSLGGAVAADLAAKYPVDLVLDRTFSSGQDQAAEVAPTGLKWLARLIAFTGSNFNTTDKLKYIKGKIFIAQENDAGHFLERMKKAAAKSRHQPPENLEKSGVITAQLKTGHLHTGIDAAPLWFSQESSQDEVKDKLVTFLNS